jgi:hypothetical protein
LALTNRLTAAQQGSPVWGAVLYTNSQIELQQIQAKTTHPNGGMQFSKPLEKLVKPVPQGGNFNQLP